MAVYLLFRTLLGWNAHAGQLVASLRGALLEVCPAGRSRPRRRWMSEASWELVRARADMQAARRRLHARWRAEIIGLVV